MRTTLTSGWRDRITSSAERPSMPGIRMSMRTRSGACRETSGGTCAPESVSATTSKPSASSSARRRASSISRWSSAMTTLMATGAQYASPGGVGSGSAVDEAEPGPALVPHAAKCCTPDFFDEGLDRPPLVDRRKVGQIEVLRDQHEPGRRRQTGDVGVELPTVALIDVEHDDIRWMEID